MFTLAACLFRLYRGLKGRARFALNGRVPLVEPFAAAKIASFARPAVLPVASREAALGANG
jgi:hypothetical protein